jgi:hypothetical protein
MISLESISQTLVTLEVGENQVLFILLAEDGSINRKGDGSPNCKDNDFFIGKTNEKLFEQLKPYINEEMVEYLHSTYDIPDKEGRTCSLKILFKSNEMETGVEFKYGELSQGPPSIFRDFTIKALQLTNKWHQQQKQMMLTANSTKPNTKAWWKFW